MEQTSTGLQTNRPVTTHKEQVDDSVMQISGTRHWFLEGWIGDHLVEFLVDSGSSVTAMSNSFYQTLVHAGAPLGVLGPSARTLRSANGTGIGVSGCSNCVVSYMGLQMEFPILVCDLATGTDAIIGTDAPCCHIPWTLRMAPVQGGASLQLQILLFPVVFLQWATARYHLIQRLCRTVLYGLPAVVRCHPVVYWRA